MKISIDTNVLMAIFKREENVNGVNRYAAGKRLIERIRRENGLIVVSTLLVFEVLEGLQRLGLPYDDRYDIRRWENFALVSADYTVIKLATDIKRQCSLERKQKVDAVLLATALHSGASAFYTWDNELIERVSRCPSLNLKVENPPRVRDLFV